jgi:hypothetical protein
MHQLAPEPTAVAPRPAPAAATEELIGGLRQLVAENSRRWKLVIALEALGLGISAPLAYLWLVFYLDNWLHLPVWGRVLASVGFLAGLAWAVRLLLQRWRALRLTEDQVALAIERHTPGAVHNRLINAVQFARATNGDRHVLTDAVVEENCTRLRQMHLEAAARLRPALLGVAGVGLLVGIGLVYALLQPAQLGNAAARIFFPLADIEPLYRTRLEVAPGNAVATGELTLSVTVHGERPGSLTVLRRQHNKLMADVVAVPEEDGPVRYTFHDVAEDFTYAVRGGDFESPYFQVTVPRRVLLTRVSVIYHYPPYTRLAEKTVESTGGDLEALEGTHADLTFRFDQPLDEARLILNPSSGKNASQRLTRQDDGKEFTGQIRIADVSSYRLEMIHGREAPERSPSFSIRALKDQPPKLELVGLDQRTEVQPDSVLPLQIVATDDFGLEKVGLFVRRGGVLPEKAAKDEGWKSVAQWSGKGKKSFRATHDFAVASLNVAEGDVLELALRGIDSDPQRKGAWTTGTVYQFAVGGEGVALQLQYEQVLRTEADLKALIRSEQESLDKVAGWLRKLDGGDLRWDEAKNIDALHAAVKGIGAEQKQVRQAASRAAQAMVAEAGNLRIGLGMLADTEMVRIIRILDSVPGQAQPPGKRAALAECRLTQERVLRSLQDMLEQYASFRSDWELTHMIPFTKMLAERQAKLRDQSKGHVGHDADKSERFQRQSVGRRQQKVLDLCKLIRPAFIGLAARLQEEDSILSKAFADGAGVLGAEALQGPMRRATTDAHAGRWSEAARQQALAADGLAKLHANLRRAQAEATKKALAALKERAKSDLQAQRALEELAPGSADRLVKDFPNDLKLEDLMRIREVHGAKKGVGNKEELDFSTAEMTDVDRKIIELEKDSGVRQDPYALTLGKEPEKENVMPLYKGKDRNAVKPFLQEKFDDLVGKLLEETEEVYKNYQTLNLSTNRNNNDPGDVGKIGGKLNSTGAVTATGNKRPPNLQSGGVARTGRQGARAYGMVADQDTFNRKGRDKALEGELQVADQAGKNKMHDTDEMQKDLSTGVGGKKIESNDNHFSMHDAGKWKDEYAKRLEKPQKKNYLVERQDGKFDAKSAAMLRDLTSKQEQVIERLKAIKKELRNLYLPTEHLEDLATALQTGLDNLKERPDAEMFRLQVQNLEKLRGALHVFRSASAGFQPSLPRERGLKGRVLDEPARPVLPGYEDAVKEYYLRLATQ